VFFLLFAFSKLNANNAFTSLKGGNDSLNVTDTVLISTEHYDETTIYLIDSICKRHEEILQKMPVPIFVPPQGGKMNYLGNDTYAIEYDSINKLISINHYKEKLGSDTLGDIIREIFYYCYSDNSCIFRIKYSNYKTGELIMYVLTEYYTINTNITYFSKNKIVKIEGHSMLKYKSEDSIYQSHIYSYYKNENLVGANVISPCKIKYINIFGDYHHISFDQCTELSLMTRINKNKFSQKSMAKADKLWVKQK
jgi:hypothetical protein